MAIMVSASSTERARRKKPHHALKGCLAIDASAPELFLISEGERRGEKMGEDKQTPHQGWMGGELPKVILRVSWQW